LSEWHFMARKQRIRLTPRLRDQIVAAVRGGAYPHVAAAAFGISRDLFDAWLHRGGAADAREPYRSLFQEVQAAHAQARVRAEVNALEEAPKFWLESGPGRDRAGEPGWASAVKASDAMSASRNALLEPEILDLIRAFCAELTSHPELRRRISQVLSQRGIPDPAEAKSGC
jgi:hypothetical protein